MLMSKNVNNDVSKNRPLACMDSKNRGFRKKTDVIIITCPCGNEGCDIFFYRINVFECFSAERENAANTTDLTHRTLVFSTHHQMC